MRIVIKTTYILMTDLQQRDRPFYLPTYHPIRSSRVTILLTCNLVGEDYYLLVQKTRLLVILIGCGLQFMHMLLAGALDRHCL